MKIREVGCQAIGGVYSLRTRMGRDTESMWDTD